MIFLLTDTMTIGFSTMLGVNVGFEILTGADFAKTGMPMKWVIMFNLFAVRINLTKYDESQM